MPNAFYTLVVNFIFNLLILFYYRWDIFLTVFILSSILLFILLSDVFIQEFHNFKRYLNSKDLYKHKRKMSSIRRINLTSDSSLNESMNGYNYGRTKSNLRTCEAKSPVRTNSIYSAVDENLVSKTDFQNYTSFLSPIRFHNNNSPVRTSPLSYSRRYNTESRNESPLRSQCSGILIPESPPPRPTPKRKPSFSGSGLGSPGLGGRMASTANEMGVDEFPWICPTAPIIPIIQSASSPLRDSPRSNRVRVRLTPHNSDSSMTASSIDASVTAADDSSNTVKSVIQVLKEVSRKRSFIPTEEEEEQQEAKRRPEHNLYMPRLTVEEENPPLPQMRVNTEDDRKRIREPDWESPNLSSKRRRKNTYIVNNEILSSLSSSIGLTQSILSPSSEARKQKASIGTQVNLLKDSPDKKQTEQGAQTVFSKPIKEVKEAATMPDPPPPSRPRSPVTEKVPNANVLLKSALSKFKIQPNEDSKKTGDLKAPLSFVNPLSNASSSLVKSSSSATTSSTTVPPVNSIEKSTLSLGSQGSNFSMPMTTSAGSLGSLAPTEKPSEKSNETTKDLKKDDKAPFGFGLSTSITDGSKSESPFKFGTSISQPSTIIQSSPEKNITSATVTTSSTPSTFTFGSPNQVPTSFGVSKAQESVNSAVSTTPSLHSTQTSSALVPSSNSPAISTFQFGNSVGKSNEQGSADKNESNKNNLFSFGKVENKSESEKPDSKPFSLTGSGAGGFSFGQSANKENTSVLFGSSTVTTTASNTNPALTFGDNTKKEEKSGGFSFKVPSVSSPSTNNKSIFSFTGATSSAPSATQSSNTVNTAPKSATPIFPTSLFGSNTTTTNSGSTTTVASSTPQATTALVTSSTFGATFGTPSTSTTAVSSSFSTGTTSLFTSGSTATTAKPSIFGGSTTTSQTEGSSLFGNTITQTNSAITTTAPTAPVFGSSTTPAFGSSASALANPTITTSSTSTFGGGLSTTPSLFGNTGAAPAFGSTTTTPAFGITTSAAPTFGSTTTTAPAFGSTTSAAATFGSTTTPAPTFGNSTTPAPAFGSTTTSAPTFGTSATPAFGSGITSPALTFGTTTTSAPTFGANTPAFGQTAVTKSGTTPAFGSSTFGSASSGTATPAFGSGTSTLFGGNSAMGNNATGSATPAFGASSTPTANTPAFGSGTSSAFGSATTPSFGGGSTTSGSTAVTPFGSQNQGFQGFGSSTPTFGAQSTFGSQNTTTAFGSTPAFGSSTTPAPAFGSSSTTASTPAFGSKSSTTPTPAFGTTSSTTPAPAFGAASSSTPAPAFGAASSSTPAPAFGSTNSATPTPAFGSSNTTTPALTFGSSAPTTFGSSTFGNQDANKPFTFNAPGATQPAAPQTGGFNFGGFNNAATPQPRPGLFQFGATNSNNQANVAFQFSATQQSATPVGGQQMFSIGSGSTAPRRTTVARRKK